MNAKLAKIVALSKRRGFVFPNSEIYGGLRGFYDYGPLGVELKNNLKQLWWHWMTRQHENIVGIDGAIISHPRVWQVSGHVEHFTDPLVECKRCHHRFRATDLLAEKTLLALEKKKHREDEYLQELTNLLAGEKCPDCGGELLPPQQFNILVEARLGVLKGAKQKVYLRGEACQNIYLNYELVRQTMRLKLPFGIVQIGKAFRNEITPKQFLLRQREFEQWDLQWFVHPDEMEKWYEYWKNERLNWYRELVNDARRVRLRQHLPGELAHYAKVAFDIEYHTPFGWKEWEGIHWRGDWDLSRHGQFSGRKFIVRDEKTGKSFVPWIVETSGGVDRTFLYLLLDAYHEEKVKGKLRIVLKLKAKLAPYKMAVFPLLANKPDLRRLAWKLYQQLKRDYLVAWDERGNIGKRYFAQDEIGTPWCVTVDFQTLKDGTVTIRERDSRRQERFPLVKVKEWLRRQLENAK